MGVWESASLSLQSPCQSQGSGLLSRPSLSPPRRSPTTSTESLDHAHHHKPCPILPFELRPTQPIPICRSRSADQTRYKFHSNPALTQIRLSDPLMGWPGFLSTSSQWLERTSSLKTLIERPESGFASPAVSATQLLSPHTRSHSMDHTQFPPLPPRNSSLPQQQAPPSPDSSESEVNIQETTDAMPPDFDASSSEELLPSLTGGQQRATFGKCQSTDEDVYRPERQGKANGDEEERGIGDLVMVTPPTPSRPSPRRSATAFSSANKTPNSTASQVFTGNKPKFGLQRMMHGRKGSIDSAVARETGSAHPTKHSSLPGLASLKNAIQNRRNAHKNGKQNNSPGTSPPQKRANKSGHAHRKSRDNDSTHSALSKLGGATLTILCAVNEGEGEGREEGEGRKEEVQHSVIPTSESDTDSLSSSPRTLVVECINDITNLSEENQHDIDATNTSERQSLNLESDGTSSQLNPTKNDDREQNEDKAGETTQGGRVREREVRSGPPIILISQFSMSSSASSESELSQSSDKRRGVSPPPVLVEKESTAAVGGEPTGTDWSRGVCEEEKVGEGGSREGSTEERDGTDKSKEKALPRGTEGDEILCVEERTDATELSVSSSAFSITAKTSESRHNRTRENHSSSLSTSERNSSAVSPEAQSIAPSPLTNTLTTCSENNTSTQLSFNHDNQSLEPLSPSSLPPPSESPSATTSSLPPPTNKPTSNNPKSPPINKSHESRTTTSKPPSEATTSSPNTGTKLSPIPTTPFLPKPSKKQDSSKPKTFRLQKTHASPTGTSSGANDAHSTARKPRKDGPDASKTSQPVSESSSITGRKSQSPPTGDPGTSEATETTSPARKYRSNNSAGNSRTTAHHSTTDSPRTARKTRNEATIKGVRELSKIFENGDTASATGPHQVIRKSRSTMTGLNFHLSSYSDNSGRGLQNGSHNNSHQDGSHSSNGQSVRSGSHDDSGQSVRSGSHDDSGRSVRSTSNDDSGWSVRSVSNDDSGRSIQSGSHDDSGWSLRVESNLKKSVSASHLHQWVGQSKRERAESTRSSLPPVSESMRVVAKKDRASSLDDLLTPRPLPSSSLSVATTIRNSVVQIQTITDNYLLPRQLENKQHRVLTSGPVRKRKDPVPIPVQNRTGEQELMAAMTEEILNNGQLRQRQELNNYRSRPTEPKLDHGRPKNDKSYTIQTQLVPKNKKDNQTISPPRPSQTHQNRKQTKIDHRLPNGSDHSPHMVKDLAAKFGGSEVKRDTVPNHSRPSLPDHTQNGHAQHGVISREHTVKSEGFEFMGARVYTATGRRWGEGEEGREGRERVGGGGEGERRDEGGRVRGRPSIKRGRRVTKDHRPKVSRTDNSNGNNNTRKPVSRDLSGDSGHAHPLGETIVDNKHGTLRTMC